MQALQGGKLLPAGRAPARPEVEQHHPPLIVLLGRQRPVQAGQIESRGLERDRVGVHARRLGQLSKPRRGRGCDRRAQRQREREGHARTRQQLQQLRQELQTEQARGMTMLAERDLAQASLKLLRQSRPVRWARGVRTLLGREGEP